MALTTSQRLTNLETWKTDHVKNNATVAADVADLKTKVADLEARLEKVEGTTPPVVIPPTPTPMTVSQSISNGQTLTGSVIWSAGITSGTPDSVEFTIDGGSKWVENTGPYIYNGDPDGKLDTTTLANDTHSFIVKAINTISTAVSTVTATVSNTIVVTPPPTTGTGMPTADLPGWKVKFAEDFNTDVPLGGWLTSSYKNNFSAYPKDWNDTAASQGHKGGKYDPAIISVHDSSLDMFIHTEGGSSPTATDGTHRVCVPTIIGDYSSMRLQFRFKADSLHGYKTAWLLWPKSGTWPRDGEIDFPEGDLDTTIGGFMHRQGASSGSDQAGAKNSGKKYTDWHVGILEWVGGKSCKFILDDVVLLNETSRVPNTPMHFVFQTETTLSGFTPQNNVQGHVLLDYVTMWLPA